MAYCFKRTESVPKAIRRVGGERLAHALECLQRLNDPEAIHCARKDIKRVRALMRLIRSRLTNREFRRTTRFLRQAAALLAPSRDAYIKVATLRELSRQQPEGQTSRTLRQLRAALRKPLEEEMKRYATDDIASAVAAKLRCAQKALADLDVRGEGWNAIRRGVKTTYRKGRRSHRTARKSSSAESFHAWRKRAKDLWYQVRLLRPARPGPLDALAGKLERLGEYLGYDHDLFMLREDLDARFPGGDDAPEFVSLAAVIERKQIELRAAAMKVGLQIYADKPAAFCARLDGYWQTWRA